MITNSRQPAASVRAYAILLVFYFAGLILPFVIYRSEIMDDRLFFAVSCVFIFCASLCCVSAAKVFQLLLCTVFALMIGKNICGTPGRFLFSCISFPLFFFVSANGISPTTKKRKGGQGFILAVGIISLTAALFLLCIK